ncbi:MAG: PA2817 family protein [Halieaceae bacterium]
MNDEQYRDHCLSLLGNFSELMGRQTAQASADDPLRELAQGFEQLAKAAALYEAGPELVNRLFASCPELAPAFPRELLWFLGGDCLHFMPDEELEMFQKLDEMRDNAMAEGETLDYQQAKAKLLKLQ